MRILVTRPLEDAKRTGRKLRDLGHDPVLAPVLVIEPTGRPAPEMSCDAIVATSAHASLAAMAPQVRGLPVFAVGPRTAAAFRGLGRIVHEAAGFAASLPGLIGEVLPPPASLLHITAPHRKQEPGLSLLRAGYRLVVWDAYEAKAASLLPPPAREALLRGDLGMVMHYSQRSAAVFLELARDTNLEPLSPVHLCISSDAALPLQDAGFATILAEYPTEDAMLDAVRNL